MRLRTALVCALASVWLAPLPAGATIFGLQAILTGGQETPPVPSDAHGVAAITYDDETNVLGWSIAFTDLGSPLINAHIHGPAVPGVPADVQVPIPFDPGVFADTIVGKATLTEEQEQQLLAGLWYVNLHTENFPNGEIRGQVTPEPTTALLLVAGLAALARAPRRTAG